MVTFSCGKQYNPENNIRCEETVNNCKSNLDYSKAGIAFSCPHVHDCMCLIEADLEKTLNKKDLFSQQKIIIKDKAISPIIQKQEFSLISD